MTPRKDPAWRRWGEGLRPLPETLAAIDELEPIDEIDDVLEDLLERGRRVRELVPDCVGLSLATMVHGVTLTLVASDLDIAILDALQYLDAGPCVETAARAEVVTFDREDRDSTVVVEEQWQLFADATSVAGVRSTLTLPILAGGEITGSVNLYAASVRAFEGLHEQVAEVFSAWAPGAIRNADMSFATRELARNAPQILRDAAKVAAAVGVMLAAFDLEEREARRRLRDAAVRGGVEEVKLAEAILDLLGK